MDGLPKRRHETAVYPYSEAAPSLIQAYRTAGARSVTEQRLRSLEAALAASEAEALELRARLRAFESSTSWRLTRPIRAAIDRVLNWRRRVARRPGKADPAFVATGPSQYVDWIRTGETNCRYALLQHLPAAGIAPLSNLALVLWATPGCEPALAALLADCPAECRVLVLEHGAASSPQGTQHARVSRVAMAPDCSPADGVAVALAQLDADMIGFHDLRDQLAPGAIGLILDVLAQHGPVDLLFADEDWLDAQGRRAEPFFKPGWDPELQRGRDLVGGFAFFRTALLRAVAVEPGPAWLYDLANQVAASARRGAIHHIPAVLCHRAPAPADTAAAQAIAAMALFRRSNISAQVEPHPAIPAWRRIRYAIPNPAPLVSIIVPTRDRADLLLVCAEGVLRGTDYPRLELLIVDNGSTEADALALLQRLAADDRVTIIRQPGSFNWSALNNEAASRAAGGVLVLLNNDIAVLQPDWLTELVSHALQPGVGAVGAKLLYPDGRVQHAGLTTDESGVPRHLFRYLGGDAPGAFGLACVARQVWGITGACMAIPRAVFVGMGGLNEAFPVAYNDVEFCLRLNAHGYRIIWTPWALLEHHEMATRPSDQTDARRDLRLRELETLRRNWGEMMVRDPFFNANLQLVDEQPYYRKTPPPVAM